MGTAPFGPFANAGHRLIEWNQYGRERAGAGGYEQITIDYLAVGRDLDMHMVLYIPVAFDGFETLYIRLFEERWPTAKAALPEIARRVRPRVICLGNLFRDQLDRYGELEHVAERWRAVARDLPAESALVVNGDDPQVGDLARERRGSLRPALVRQRLIEHFAARFGFDRVRVVVEIAGDERGLAVVADARAARPSNGDVAGFGKLEEMRSMIPARKKRRARVKKLPKHPIHDG